jgi:hypothetical protein
VLDRGRARVEDRRRGGSIGKGEVGGREKQVEEKKAEKGKGEVGGV